MTGIDPTEYGELRAEVRHLRTQLSAVDGRLAEMARQMDDLQDLLAQVRGARWTLGALVTAGGMLGGAGAWIAGLLRLPAP